MKLALATVDTFRNQIVNISAETLLRSLPDNSVHCIVTSPPYYGLRDYGTGGQIGLEDTPDEYVARLVELFREARRVLREDGTCWVVLGDSYSSIGHKKAHSGFGTTGLAGGKAQEHHPTGREDTGFGCKHKDLMGIPWRVALALQADGWWLRSDIIWHKPNPMPESVTDRPTIAHEYVFLLTKAARYWYDADAIREGHKNKYSPATMEERRNAGESTYGGGSIKGLTIGQNRHAKGVSHDFAHPNGRNRRTVWTVPTEAKPFPHFAMFPQALIEPMILAGCPETVCSACGGGYVREVERKANYTQRQDRGQPNGKGAQVDSSGWEPATVTDHGFAPPCACNAATSRGIVFDPFMGGGTTALVAKRLNRHFIGCDINPEYVELARQRVRYHGDDKRMVKEVAAGVEQLPLFAI